MTQTNFKTLKAAKKALQSGEHILYCWMYREYKVTTGFVYRDNNGNALKGFGYSAFVPFEPIDNTK